MAVEIQRLGPKYVLLKGGHLPLNANEMAVTSNEDAVQVINVLTDGNVTTIYTSPYSKSRNTHGTGCTLASAVASQLALGKDMANAVRLATSYVGMSGLPPIMLLT